MAEVQPKLGKVQIALETLGKQIDELESVAASITMRTEPCRLEEDCVEDCAPEEARDRLSPVANTVMLYCDRIETATKRLQGVLHELEL